MASIPVVESQHHAVRPQWDWKTGPDDQWARSRMRPITYENRGVVVGGGGTAVRYVDYFRKFGFS